jgi:dihydroorotate dehydrogenase (NAD+) catalytic subunit
MSDLRVTLGSLTLANPVLAAAGTFGYGLEFARAVRLDHLGAVITKTLTRHPREGHLPPRLAETPSGLLNAVGLQNIGLEAFLREKLPLLRGCGTAVIVSLLGDSASDVAWMAQQLDRAEGAAAIELNLSCPNLQGVRGTGHGAGDVPRPTPRAPRPMMVSQDAEATAQIIRAARGATTKPLIAKLSPDVTDLVPIAQAAERAGADALTIGNTFVGMSLDPATRRSRLGTLTGGLSGPAIRPLAVYRVWYTAQSVRVPVIGLGGVVRAEDAVEFFLAGASAVGVGTATFADPQAPLRVLRGLEQYLRRHRLASLHALRGALVQAAG